VVSAEVSSIMQKAASPMKTYILFLSVMLSASALQAASRPNLLFIYTDDQRYDAMSVVQKEQGERGRFPWFQTPNMDRLAAEGVRFRNAFVVCSLCAPSRAVNLTGRYNHLNGIASNFRPFPIDNVTHASLLRAAGYTTAYVGKWHMDSQRERPGFDHHYSFIAHARYWDPVFIVDGKDTPTKGWIDDISTDYAIEFMKSQKGSAKLIRYPGHDDWTELFDLKSDPYETSNLFKDPNYAALRAKMEAEHDRLASEVGYRVPEYVDRPPWWGKPGGPDWKPEATPGIRLHFDFAKLEGDRVPDLSGYENHGRVHNAMLADWRDGKKALRLQGDGWVEVPKSDSLNPTDIAWTAEAVFKSEKPDGMVLARGGKSQGYALWLKQGRPAFTVVIDGKPVTLEAKEAVTDRTTVIGTITSDRKATLHVDGRLAADAALPGLIPRNPSDTMQIGADLGSPVVEPAPPKFTGWIERVRLFSGGSSEPVRQASP
jgi:hypothetical protein